MIKRVIMFKLTLTNTCLFVTLAVYAIISKCIFDRVYLTLNLVIDEEFHLALGKAYCNFDFTQWHPKVTTFPGLYLLSSLLLGPFKQCSTYALRSISLLLSTVNIILFYRLLKISNKDTSWKHIWSAVNLALLPPLYFFAHLYYTDVISLTMILLLFITSFEGRHFLAATFGMFAILCRQTNVVWVGMACGIYVLKALVAIENKKSTDITLKAVLNLLKLTPGKNLLLTLCKAPLEFWLNVACYASLLVSFALFVFLNGSIVVGDKTAHEATIHLTQIFYFSLFSLFFALPHFLGSVKSFVHFVTCRKFTTASLVLLSLVIIHYNTLVHPYLLADNRHYMFYIWNRFYGRYGLFKYLMVPVYLFALYVITTKLYYRKDVHFLLFFIPCTLVVLMTQRLVELRYFYIPYVLFRSQIKHTTVATLVLESAIQLLVNLITFYIFFTKTIEWPEFDCPQRLIW